MALGASVGLSASKTENACLPGFITPRDYAMRPKHLARARPTEERAVNWTLPHLVKQPDGLSFLFPPLLPGLTPPTSVCCTSVLCRTRAGSVQTPESYWKADGRAYALEPRRRDKVPM